MRGAEDPLTGVRRRDLPKVTGATCLALLVDQVFRGRPGLIAPDAELWQVQQTVLEPFNSES
jgi:hypothetical protein